MTNATSGGLKLKCIAIATFSTVILIFQQRTISSDNKGSKSVADFEAQSSFVGLIVL